MATEIRFGRVGESYAGGGRWHNAQRQARGGRSLVARLLGDDVEDRGEEHEGVGVGRGIGPAGEEVGGLLLGQFAGLDEARDEGLPEGRGPVPHGAAGAGEAVVGVEVGEGESGAAEHGGEVGDDVGVAATGAPGAGDGVDHLGEGGLAGREGHVLVVEVVLDDEAGTGFQEAGDGVDDGLGVFDEAEDPAGVGEVESGGLVWGVGKDAVDVVDVADEGGDGRDVTRGGGGVQVIDKLGGFVDANDAACGADDVGEVEGGVTGAAADVEDRLAGGDACLGPGLMGGGGPEAVLEAEAPELGCVGAEDVFGGGGGGHRRGG